MGYKVVDTALMQHNIAIWHKDYSAYTCNDAVFDSAHEELGLDGSRHLKPQFHAGAAYTHPVTGMLMEKHKFRRQGPKPGSPRPWQIVISTMMAEECRRLGVLYDKSGQEKWWDWAVKMTSDSGGPWQPGHADSAPRDSLAEMDYANVPLAVLLATEDNTKVMIWPKGSETPTIETLSAGQMIIMRGDLGHAGASYTNVNSRIHMYLDTRWVTNAGEPTAADAPLTSKRPLSDRDTFIFCKEQHPSKVEM